MEYMKLAQGISKMSKNKNSFMLGTVNKLSPLTVALNGINFNEHEMLMNADLKGRNFNIGDKVLFINNNGELILICKVV